MEERLMWESQAASGKETGRDAAARYVQEMHGVYRDIRWKDGLFTFSDAAWWYRVEMVNGGWKVYRTDQMTKKRKEYVRARREFRPQGNDEDTIHGDDEDRPY